MATYNGTLKNDVFFLSFHSKGDVIYGDGLTAEYPGYGHNQIHAGRGNDLIFAGYGRDVVTGGAGNDTIYGYGPSGPTPGAVNAYAERDLADRLWGGAGNDFIAGGGGNDRIWGGTGNDMIFGGSGNDVIRGGAGDDVISSGAGADNIAGGAGRDIFVYAYDPFLSEQAYDANDGTDTILDFKPGTDKIDLSGYALTEADVQILRTARGTELHFNAVYEEAQINLLGVRALQDGDIIFA
ncbi:calcium-binding protein [Teichococcus oryzae]|uniref:Calcium-binding protein n=1 Tax=Teichococcus oryzae TaxID=1608942 RepID=A0A5B2TE90_9PROT|nr:calcium-binding protein [Pseudoroseomonas oryzae]KAA2212777.1 calcium-binding protein [Pseudoroseomonas oryzae]